MPDNNFYQQWQQRTDQDNLQLNRNWLKQHVVPLDQVSGDQRVVFSHIPKNAGTTLEYILAKNYQLSEVLHVNAPDLNKQPHLLELKKNQPRLICGHHPMHGLLYQLLPDEPVVHITMLRDPVDRVISYYNYISGNNRHPLHGLVKDMGFDDFIEHPELTEISNGQAKRLSGYLHTTADYDATELFERSKAILEQCFTLVMVTESFDQGVLLLQSLLQLKDIHALPQNQSHKKIQRRNIGSDQQSRIVQRNAVDARLHGAFKTRFDTLFQQHLSDDDLARFLQQHQHWRQLLKL